MPKLKEIMENGCCPRKQRVGGNKKMNKSRSPSCSEKECYEDDDHAFNTKIETVDLELNLECEEMEMIDKLLAENEKRMAKLGAELDKFLTLGEKAAAICNKSDHKNLRLSKIPSVQDLVYKSCNESGSDISVKPSVDYETTSSKRETIGLSRPKYLSKSKIRPRAYQVKASLTDDSDAVASSSSNEGFSDNNDNVCKQTGLAGKRRPHSQNKLSAPIRSYSSSPCRRRKLTQAMDTKLKPCQKFENTPRNIFEECFEKFKNDFDNKEKMPRQLSQKIRPSCPLKFSVKDEPETNIGARLEEYKIKFDKNLKMTHLPTQNQHERSPSPGAHARVEGKSELERYFDKCKYNFEQMQKKASIPPQNTRLSSPFKTQGKDVEKITLNICPEKCKHLPPQQKSKNSLAACLEDYKPQFVSVNKPNKKPLIPCLFSKFENGKRCFPNISDVQTKDQTRYMAERDAYLLFRREKEDNCSVEKPNEFEIFFNDYMKGTGRIDIPIYDAKCSKLEKIMLEPTLKRNVIDLSLDCPDRDPQLLAELMNEKLPVWSDPLFMSELVTPLEGQKRVYATDVRITAPGSMVPKAIPVDDLNKINPRVMERFEAIFKSSECLYPDDVDTIGEIKDVVVVKPGEEDYPESDSVPNDNLKCEIELHPFRVETHFQLRGANTPVWYPGMFTAFPDGGSAVKLINTPSNLINTAWRLCAP